MERSRCKIVNRTCLLAVFFVIFFQLPAVWAIPMRDPSLASDKKEVILTSAEQIPDFINIGRGYLGRGDLNQVVSIAEQILALQPENLQALALRAATFRGDNHEEKFEDAAHLFYRQAPDSALLQLFLAEMYLGKGNLRKAESAYQKGLASDPADIDSRMGLAVLYGGQGKVTEATTEYNTVLKAGNLAPKDFLNASYALCRLDLQQKKYDKVIERANRVADLYPPVAVSYQLLAAAYLGKNQADQAIAAYTRLLQAAPDSAVPYQELAVLYAEKIANFEKGLEYGNQAVKKSPQDAKSHDVLGWIHFLQQRYEPALISFAEAVKLAGKNPFYLYHHGLALEKLGRKEEAGKSFQRALALLGQDNTPFAQELRAAGNRCR